MYHRNSPYNITTQLQLEKEKNKQLKKPNTSSEHFPIQQPLK